MVLLPKDEGVCWIDNFIVTADSEVEAKSAFQRFLTRCKSVNAELNVNDVDYGVPLQDFCVLGIQFNLSTHSFRSEPKWIRKVLEKDELLTILNVHTCTPRSFYTVFGSLVWHGYTTRKMLCFLSASLTFVQSLATRTHTDIAEWDKTWTVPPSVLCEIRLRLDIMKANAWVMPLPVRWEKAWSDASSSEWAAVLDGTPDRIAQGLCDVNTHIYLKELLAARNAVRLAARFVQGIKLRLMVDNLPAVFSINRGHSSNFAANKILCNLFDTAREANIHVHCDFVPTHLQKADKYTRGTRADCPIDLV